MKTLFKSLLSPRRLAMAVGLGAILATTAAGATSWSGNLVQRLERDGRFTTLLTALNIAGLKETVATGGPFTILAPTDEAFAALPSGTVESLVTNVPALQNILLYHVVDGNQSAKELLRERKVETLQGSDVRIYKKRNDVFVNRSEVIAANVSASNGTIHAINQVLLPPAH